MNDYIFSLSIENYEEELERKNKLESKSLGYLSFISLILAIITAFYIFFLENESIAFLWKQRSYYLIINLMTIYIFILSFEIILLLLLSLKIKTVYKYEYSKKINEKLKNKNNTEFEKIVSKRLIECTDKNIIVNNRTEFYIKIAYFLLIIVIILFGLMLITSLITLIGGKYAN